MSFGQFVAVVRAGHRDRQPATVQKEDIITMNRSERFHGTVLAPGFALGNAFRIGDSPPRSAGDPPALVDVHRELHLFKQSIAQAVEELENLVEQLQRNPSPEPADIARVHLAMLNDVGFHDDVRHKIATSGLRAEHAIEVVVHEMVALFERSGNEVLAERSADLKDLEFRLKTAMGGRPSNVFGAIGSEGNQIALVEELLPSFIFDAPSHNVTGFLVAKGTPLAHAVILARLYGIPVLKTDHLSRLENGTPLLLDGINGDIVTEPDETEVQRRSKDSRSNLAVLCDAPLSANLWLSIIDPLQLESTAVEKSAGIGLYRTEVLFMKSREDFPGEEEQCAAYRALFQRCGDKPVTIRTLDIGGDKLLPYFSLGPQANPYMGFRAHRIWRFHPEILICQIRAIMRAAGTGGRLRILYPMIETVDSLTFVQKLVRDAVSALRRERVPIPEQYEEGVLVEVPSAVWDYSALLERVDYTSLGTNDLLQYFFAADRNNPNIGSFYIPEHPAVLRMLHWIAERNIATGKPLGICGELASDRAYLPLLIGLGIRDLSVAPNVLPDVCANLSALDPAACAQLAQAAMAAASASEVLELLQDFGGLASDVAGSGVPADSDVIDPICGMIVSADSGTLSVTDWGKTIYFCSPRCRLQFLAEKTR
jgi:phosphotransferase system enzyme I (PtsI)